MAHLNEAGIAVMSEGRVLPQGLKAWITWKRCLEKGESLHPARLRPKKGFLYNGLNTRQYQKFKIHALKSLQMIVID